MVMYTPDGRYIEWDDDYPAVDEEGDAERLCWTCDGDGWGIHGHDWSCDDPLWCPPGRVEKCPNCGGSGKAEDCWYW